MGRESIRGKTALVTGAAKRIGRETALALAAEGVNILVHYRSSEDEARELVEELQERGVQAWTIRADFALPEEYEALIPQALHIAGTLDILVNSASIFPVDTLDTLTFTSVVSNMEVNAWVPFVLSRAFKQHVGKGKIINMLDTRINSYDWTHVGYILSKHVLAVFTRMTAQNLIP